MKRNNPLFPLQCARRKNIGLGICTWDEITLKNLMRFCMSIIYLIISLALLSSGIMAAADQFGSSSDIDIQAILGNSAFTPYITGCVVNFNVSMNKQ
jgi:hypothetical protein